MTATIEVEVSRHVFNEPAIHLSLVEFTEAEYNAQPNLLSSAYTKLAELASLVNFRLNRIVPDEAPGFLKRVVSDLTFPEGCTPQYGNEDDGSWEATFLCDSWFVTAVYYPEGSE